MTQTQPKTVKKNTDDNSIKKTTRNVSSRTPKTPRAKQQTVPSTPVLPSNPFQFEILELVSKQRVASKKEDILIQYRNPALVSILIWNFDDSIVSLLPPGDVPFADFRDMVVNSGNLSNKIQAEISGNVSKIEYNGIDPSGNIERTSLRQQVEQLTYYIAGKRSGSPYSINNIKRENMFITLLQKLHPLEAEILILVKDKKLTDKYKITFDNVKNAYPDIQWGNR